MNKCCDYHAGLLKSRAELQHAVTTSLGGGASEVTYDTYDTVWAFFRQLSGNEAMRAMRVDAETRNRVLIRYRDDVRDSDRIIIDNRAYNITYIENIEYNRVWLLIDIDGGVPYAGGE